MTYSCGLGEIGARDGVFEVRGVICGYLNWFRGFIVIEVVLGNSYCVKIVIVGKIFELGYIRIKVLRIFFCVFIRFWSVICVFSVLRVGFGL